MHISLPGHCKEMPNKEDATSSSLSTTKRKICSNIVITTAILITDNPNNINTLTINEYINMMNNRYVFKNK